MRTSKKMLSLLLAFAVAISCLAIPSVDTQAATVKKNTYTYDAKKGIAYETATRVGIKERFRNSIQVYLKNSGDYIASVKSSSTSLIAKVTESSTYSTYGCAIYEDVAAAKDVHFSSNHYIEFFAKKGGKYTVTFTIKNAKKKTVATKKVTVYAAKAITPLQYLQYAGTKYFWEEVNTTKASGAVKIKANPTYTIKGIYFGTYDAKGEIQYKKIKSGAKITLATSTVYTDDYYYSDYSNGDYKNIYEYYTTHDYIKPISFVKVTYYDKYLKTTNDYIFSIINIK